MTGKVETEEGEIEEKKGNIAQSSSQTQLLIFFSRCASPVYPCTE
jgi:hypothetical protein